MKKVKWTAHGRNRWDVFLSGNMTVVGMEKTIVVEVHNPATGFFMSRKEIFGGIKNQEEQTKRMMDMIEADPNFVSTEGPRKHRPKNPFDWKNT